jgi:ribosomal protein L6P/L9E
MYDISLKTCYFFKSKALNFNLFHFNFNKIFYKLYGFNKYFLKKFYYCKVILQGLGYKFFFNRGLIYILLGLSHYVLIEVPQNIYIRCRKKKIFLFSTNKLVLSTLCKYILSIRKLNLYKIKGLYFFKLSTLKTYIYFKKGKKQQFM